MNVGIRFEAKKLPLVRFVSCANELTSLVKRGENSANVYGENMADVSRLKSYQIVWMLIMEKWKCKDTHVISWCRLAY